MSTVLPPRFPNGLWPVGRAVPSAPQATPTKECPKLGERVARWIDAIGFRRGTARWGQRALPHFVF